MQQSIGVLLLPGFSDWAYTSVVQTLAAANRIASTVRYDLTSLSIEASMVKSDNSVCVHTLSLNDAETRFDTIIVIASTETKPESVLKVAKKCQLLCQPELWIGIEIGSQVLAAMGALDGYKAAVWDTTQCFSSYAHRIRFSDTPYILDRNRLTCNSHQLVFPALVLWLIREHGFDYGQKVKGYLQTELRYLWPEHDQMTTLESLLSNRKDKKLTEALELMHANLTEPLAKSELATHIGISCRQLERLFKTYLQVTPCRYYMMIRLEAVKRDIRKTHTSLAELADRYGFSSSAHLSYCYKNHFTRSPSKDRP